MFRLEAYITILRCRKPTLGSTYDMGLGSRGGSLKPLPWKQMVVGCHSRMLPIVLSSYPSRVGSLSKATTTSSIYHDQHHTVRKWVLASVQAHREICVILPE